MTFQRYYEVQLGNSFSNFCQLPDLNIIGFHSAAFIILRTAVIVKLTVAAVNLYHDHAEFGQFVLVWSLL